VIPAEGDPGPRFFARAVFEREQESVPFWGPWDLTECAGKKKRQQDEGSHVYPEDFSWYQCPGAKTRFE